MKPFVLPIAAGGLMALGQSPASLWPAMLAGLALFAHLFVRSRSPLRAAGSATLVASTYFALSISYVGNAFMLDGAPINATAILAVIAMNSLLHAPYWIVGLAAARVLAPASDLGRILLFAGALGLAEWLRGSLMLGVPIGLFAMTWSQTPLETAVSLFGLFGLNALTILAGGLIGLATAPGMGWRPCLSAASTVAAGAGILIAFGHWHRDAGATAIAGGSSTTVGLVQTGRRITVPDTPDVVEALRAQTLASTAEAARAGAQLVVWPETALPSYIEHDAHLRADIAAALAQGLPGASLLAGSLRIEVEGKDYRYFNSMLHIDQAGEVRTAYDKRSFVPYGETLPRPFLALGFRPVAGLSGINYTPGTAPRTIEIAGVGNITPIICFEGLLPGNVRAENARSDLLVVGSNDGFFEGTAGIERVFHISRMRSIELGLPMVRAAVTGRTAVIDALGRIMDELPLYDAGLLLAVVPMTRVPTVYARVGDAILIAMLGAMLAGGLSLRPTSRLSRSTLRSG